MDVAELRHSLQQQLDEIELLQVTVFDPGSGCD